MLTLFAIESEIAALEPQEKAAWAAYKEMEKSLKPLETAWLEKNRRLHRLREAAALMRETNSNEQPTTQA